MRTIGTSCVLFCVAIVLNTDKTFTLYSLIPLSWHGVIFQILLGFIEATFKIDLLLAIFFIFGTLFLYFFSMQFWLVKSWYKRRKLVYA
jgi:hypothetical protein